MKVVNARLLEKAALQNNYSYPKVKILFLPGAECLTKADRTKIRLTRILLWVWLLAGAWPRGLCMTCTQPREDCDPGQLTAPEPIIANSSPT